MYIYYGCYKQIPAPNCVKLTKHVGYTPHQCWGPMVAAPACPAAAAWDGGGPV